MKGVSELQDALQSKSLTALTRALSKVADALAYQLKPPYTEILQFKAQEETSRFFIHFQARLHLHYSNMGVAQEGLIFTIQFGGDTLSDSPAPPIHELFYAGVVESFGVHGYGPNWIGRSIATPVDFTKNLEVASETVNQIDLGTFYRILQGRR